MGLRWTPGGAARRVMRGLTGGAGVLAGPSLGLPLAMGERKLRLVYFALAEGDRVEPFFAVR